MKDTATFEGPRAAAGRMSWQPRYVAVVVTAMALLYTWHTLLVFDQGVARVIDVVVTALLLGAGWAVLGGNVTLNGMKTVSATSTGFLALVLSLGNLASLLVFMGLGWGPFSLEALARCARVASFSPESWGQSLFFPTIAYMLVVLWFLNFDVLKHPMREHARACAGGLVLSQVARYAKSFMQQGDFPFICFNGTVMATMDAWTRTCSVQTLLLLGRATFYLIRDRSVAYSIFLFQPRRLTRYDAEWRMECAQRRQQRWRWRALLGLALVGLPCALCAATLPQRYYLATGGATLAITLVSMGLLLALVDCSRLARLRALQEPDLVIVAACGCAIPILNAVGQKQVLLSLTFTCVTTTCCYVDSLRPAPPRHIRVIVLQFVLFFSLFGIFLSIVVEGSQAALLHNTDALYLGHSFSIQSLVTEAYSSILSRALRASVNAVRDRDAKCAVFATDRKLREVVHIEFQAHPPSNVSTLPLLPMSGSHNDPAEDSTGLC